MMGGDITFPTPVDQAVETLSQFLQTRPQFWSYLRPPCPPPLSAVPADVMEEILLYLPGQDVIRMKQVSRAFADLISTSPFLKYRLEIFTAGLVENPRFPCSLEEGQRRVKEYVSMWKDFGSVKRRDHILGERGFDWSHVVPVGRDLLARRSGRSVSFIRVPHITAGGREIEEWTIDPPPTAFQPHAFAVYQPEDILALVEWTHPSFRIRLLDIKDGTPHHLPQNSDILWVTDLVDEQVYVPCAAITASRLMISVVTTTLDVLMIWNWRTGDVVLKCSSAEHNFLRRMSPRFAFLDEFRLLATTDTPAVNERELDLVIFDSSVPNQSSGSWRFFAVPPMYHQQRPDDSDSWALWIYKDSDRGRREDSRDGPLVVDPTQSVVALVQSDSHRKAVLVIRAATLVGCMSSRRTPRRVPWDEWKRHVVVMKTPSGTPGLRIFVLGSRILSVTYDWLLYPRSYRVQTYDFSRWGCRNFVWAGEGKKRKPVAPSPKTVRSIQTHEEGIHDLRALGDRLVSCRNPASPSEISVWEVI